MREPELWIMVDKDDLRCPPMMKVILCVAAFKIVTTPYLPFGNFICGYAEPVLHYWDCARQYLGL